VPRGNLVSFLPAQRDGISFNYTQMSYYVFSRKYRPQKFAEVLAQDHVSETLTRAIEHGRIAQAYLFCGVRGTGKTTVARILAKRLNCANPQGSEPCDQCDSCVGIIKGRSLDVLEIDAASHTSVDDVRELRESIKYAPVSGKHKVYIIDEVHRLSGSAFDALLKTLEEPPAHAVFVFATTEAHKVPQTILSRCQRYDFRRIPESELRAALRNIAEKEKLRVTDDALAELARRGDGSLRDALSILDQVASWQHEQIDMKLLTEALGILPRSEFRALLGLIREKDAAGIIGKIDEVLKAGVGAAEFVRGFQEEVRLLLVFKAAPELGTDYGMTADEAAEYRAQAAGYSLNDLLRIQNLLVALEEKIRDGFDPVINLELTLLKLMQMEESVSIEEVLKQLAGGTASIAKPAAAATAEAKKKSVSSAPTLIINKPAEAPAITPPAALTTAPAPPEFDLNTLWQDLLTALKPVHRNLQIKLSLAQPRTVEGNKVTVAFDRMGEVHVRYFQDRGLQQTLEQVAKQVSGCDLRFHFVVDPAWSGKGENGGNGGRGGSVMFAEAEKAEHPLVAKAIEIFEAEVTARRDLNEKQ